MRSLQFPIKEYRLLRSRVEQLRRKGLSYKEILEQIPVSKSTVSDWCRNISLTKVQVERLGSRYDAQLRGAKANQLKSLQRKMEARREAIEEIIPISPETAKLAGALLYWAEGNKQNGTAITNSDPTFIVFIVKWFKHILDIPAQQLSASLNLHHEQDEIQEGIQGGFSSPSSGYVR